MVNPIVSDIKYCKATCSNELAWSDALSCGDGSNAPAEQVAQDQGEQSGTIPWTDPSNDIFFRQVRRLGKHGKSARGTAKAAFMTRQGETRLGDKGGSEAIIQRDTGRQEAIPDILK